MALQRSRAAKLTLLQLEKGQLGWSHLHNVWEPHVLASELRLHCSALSFLCRPGGAGPFGGPGPG